MIILLGVKSSPSTAGVIHGVCPRCHEHVAHRLTRLVRRFTVFFVPLFRVSTRHVLDCTACGRHAYLARSVSRTHDDQRLVRRLERDLAPPVQRQSRP